MATMTKCHVHDDHEGFFADCRYLQAVLPLVPNRGPEFPEDFELAADVHFVAQILSAPRAGDDLRGWLRAVADQIRAARMEG